jgi:hypothetical protein
MPTSTSPDTIDDNAFLAELENFDGSLRDTAASHGSVERMDMLDKAFPLTAPDALASDPYPGFGDIPAFRNVNADVAPRESSAREESRPLSGPAARRIEAPALAVALVFVMGLAAGASAAAVVFYDRAAQIVAAWTAPHR